MIIVEIIAIGLVHTVAAIVLPGLSILALTGGIIPIAQQENVGCTGAGRLAKVIAVGFLVSYLVFLMESAIAVLAPAYSVVAVSFGYLVLLVLFALVLIRDRPRARLFDIVDSIVCDIRRADNALVLAISFAAGAMAVIKYPNVLDSGQLAWTKELIHGDELGSRLSILSSSGAIGYSALIFPPGVLFRNIPLVTLASGFKVLLGGMLGLACILVVENLGFRCKLLSKIALVSLVILSYFGQVGFMELGKDSSFGVAFSFLFFAFTADRNMSWSGDFAVGVSTSV